jgi:hypothetical protein
MVGLQWLALLSIAERYIGYIYIYRERERERDTHTHTSMNHDKNVINLYLDKPINTYVRGCLGGWVEF